jgi:2-methylisocitrate lyase-like PEP mutase family enzyme
MQTALTATRPTTVLKQILARRSASIFPGTPNALFARVIEELGFEAVYVTGAGIANMSLGAPDIGLVTLTELTTHVSMIAETVRLPLLVDADTGFGNPVNVTRVVRNLERAGAAGIQFEDQVFPKKCGHFSGKDVIPTGEMVQKIKAAADSRRDGDLQIVARTDAYAVLGMHQALDRANAFVEAGADATFVEAPSTGAELRRIASAIPVPQIANIVYGGLTPEISQRELAEMGFGGVLYANAALQAALKAVYDVLGSLKALGSLHAVREKLSSFDERQRMVDKARYDALEARYRSDKQSETER